MPNNRFWLCALALATTLFVSRAHADTYSVATVFNSGSALFVAGDDYGDYQIADRSKLDPGFTPGCPATAGVCYLTHLGGSTFISESLLTLPSDPHPGAGPGCVTAPSGFFGTTLCNNGHQIFLGTFDEKQQGGAYYGPDPSDFLSTGVIDATGNILTANGNFYFVDTSSDELKVALDLTTAPTPEPSSFALLGTGLLGVGGLMKRRSC